MLDNYHILWHMADFCVQKSDCGDLQAYRNTHFAHLAPSSHRLSLPVVIKVVQTHSHTWSLWPLMSRGTFYQLLSSPEGEFLESFYFNPFVLMQKNKTKRKFTIKGTSAADFFTAYAFISFCIKWILWQIYRVPKVFRIDFHCDTLWCFYIHDFTCMTNNSYADIPFSGAEVKANIS